MKNIDEDQNQKMLIVKGILFVKWIPKNFRNDKMLVEYLNIKNLLILNPNTNPRQWEVLLRVEKQIQAELLISLNNGQNLPFVELSKKQIEISSAIFKKNKQQKQFKILRKISQIGKISDNLEQKTDLSQFLDLQEVLKKGGYQKLELEFFQISFNNVKMIVSKTKQEFKVEGYCSNLQKDVRNLIKIFNI